MFMNLHRAAMMSTALVSALLMSCAQTPKQLSYYVEDPARSGEVLWPELPQVPRYRYAGQLLGEKNFVDPESDPGALATVWKWVVGLADSRYREERSLVRPQSGMVIGSRIYVTDVGLGAVFVFDRATGRLLIWDQAVGGSSFVSPIGITTGKDNTILIADSELKKVVRLSADGKMLGSFGEGILSRPTGLVRNPDNRRTYVVDTREHNIKVFNDDGELVDVIGFQGDRPGEFNAPTHIALSGGKLYVTDTLNARVQILDSDGEPLETIGKRGLYLGNLTRPKGVAVDADSNVYIVESYFDHLLVFNDQGEFLLPIGGTGNRVGQFFLPSGAWSDDLGRIYVADMYNGRVVIFQFLGG